MLNQPQMALGMRKFGELFVGCQYSYISFCNFLQVRMVSSLVEATSADNTGVVVKLKAPKGQGKLFSSMSEVLYDIHDGAKLLIGGFGACGVPENLLKTILDKGCKDLIVVANNVGAKDLGVGELLKNRRVRRIIGSYIGENRECQGQYMSGELEVEFVPQGTLVERVRAGGAGIPAFYTPTGYGTILQEGKVIVKYDEAGNAEVLGAPKSVRVFNGRKYMIETAITGDFALVKAWKADKAGNLIFRKSARNFNPTMCKAAKVTIAEAEEIVEIGKLEPDDIHLPGIYVDRIIQGQAYQKQSKPISSLSKTTRDSLTRNRIIRRAVLELKDGMYVNMGLGIPLMAADFIPKSINVILHTENGILGIGPTPSTDQIDPDIINAGKQAVSLLPGASITSSDESFTMIRGGHIDLTILGALQVSQKGDLANWIIPGTMVLGMGGAMDLVSAAETKVIITMRHTTRDGSPKIVPNCTIPLTGRQCVDLIITELAVFEVEKGKGLKLIEIATGVDIAEISSSTGCEFSVSNDLKVMGDIAINEKS